MASPKSPSQQQMLPLTDPNHVQEVFANHLAGIRVTGDVCHITLSVVRPPHAPPGGLDENVVVVRLVTPISVINGVVQALQQMARAQAQMQVQTPGKPN
jgi:hypothetical protein